MPFFVIHKDTGVELKSHSSMFPVGENVSFHTTLPHLEALFQISKNSWSQIRNVNKIFQEISITQAR